MRKTAILTVILLTIGFAMSSDCFAIGGIDKVVTDIYVDAENGSNDNEGLSEEDALRTITYAMLIYGDLDNPKRTINIHVAPGYYDKKHGEKIPLKIERNIHLYGAGPEETILCGWSYNPMLNNGAVLVFENADNAGIDGFTIQGGGRGIMCINSSPRINNCVIKDLLYHLGILIAIFDGNSAISCENSSPLITNCVITNCEGGNYLYFYPLDIVNSSPVVINCLIVEKNNNDDTRIFIEGDSHPTFVNVTMACNTGFYMKDETAMFVAFGSSVRIVNSIFWDNGPSSISGRGIVSVFYSNITGEWDGIGNIEVNPLFVKGPLGNFYLSHGETHGYYSQCVDAGSPAMTFGLDKLTTRTDGVFDSGRVDMGYHYPIE